jgi:hypothetical protein
MVLSAAGSRTEPPDCMLRYNVAPRLLHPINVLLVGQEGIAVVEDEWACSILFPLSFSCLLFCPKPACLGKTAIVFQHQMAQKRQNVLRTDRERERLHARERAEHPAETRLLLSASPIFVPSLS